MERINIPQNVMREELENTELEKKIL